MERFDALFISFIISKTLHACNILRLCFVILNPKSNDKSLFSLLI